MLNIKNLIKSFGDKVVLKSISFSLEPNETLAIIGPSGAGKSQILRCISGLETQYEGFIDTNLKQREIGVVFQHFNLFPHMSVLDNISYAQIKVLKKSKKNAETTALKLLKRVGLKGIENSHPTQLSGGQKQRVAIARALAMSPKLMLFDEPTSALDAENVKEVREVINDLSKEITSIIVTHDVRLARDIASRIIFMEAGEILADESVGKFFTGQQKPRIKGFLDKVL